MCSVLPDGCRRHKLLSRVIHCNSLQHTTTHNSLTTSYHHASLLQYFAVCCSVLPCAAWLKTYAHIVPTKKKVMLLGAAAAPLSSVTGAHACHRDRATRTFSQSRNALSIATYRKSLQRTAHCNTLQCVFMCVCIYVLATAAAGAVVTGSTGAVTCDMPHSHVWHDSFKL